MIGRPEYTLTLPPPCPTNRDHLTEIEWELVENTAKWCGIAAAEFIRNAVLAAAGEKSTAVPPGIAARIERIYRGVYLLSTLKRDEMVREGRQDELDRTMKAARDPRRSWAARRSDLVRAFPSQSMRPAAPGAGATARN